MRKSTFKLLGTFGVGVAATLAVMFAVHAHAAGIPEMDGMTYTGYLEDGDGAALTGDHTVQVSFFDAIDATDEVCDGTNMGNTALQSGRFQVPLPQECTDAVKASPDIWVEVEVDGTALPRTKLGAVPYAIEAGHATTADSLTVSPTFFSWSTVEATPSGDEKFTAEGKQTVTFDTAGYYRVTLNAQGIHDGGTTSYLRFYLAGTATRRDNMSLEAGGEDLYHIQSASEDSRHLLSTAIFVEAEVGQTLEITPALMVVYANGNFHRANFMYATEYMGPL